MRAALLHSPGSLRVEDIPRPDCPSGGLLIRVEACSVCASDVKMWRAGHRDLAYPRMLGHEMVGTILESRSRKRSLRIGARVQIWPGTACGTCPSCLKGHDNQCSSIGILGFNRDGGFAEYMAVPFECVASHGVNLVPDTLPSDLASLTEPLACCVNAQEALHVGRGDTVLVIGGGPLGAMHVMLSRSRGASNVMVLEKDPHRCQMIRGSKPDQVIDSNDREGYGKVAEAASGKGVDVIIMATPEAPVDSALISLLAPRGRLSVFSGLRKERSTSTIDLNQVHYLERTVVGSYGCRSSDCRDALRLLSSGEVDAGWLITKRLPLDFIIEALKYAESREGMKATITGI